MTDLDALLRAVRAHPDDDTPRLVYADALAEADTTGRGGMHGELIRVQVELACLPSCQVEGKVINWQTPMRACRDVFPQPQEGKGWGPHCGPCRSFVRSRSRERQLLAWACDWLVPAGWTVLTMDTRTDRSLIFRRGFADTIICEGSRFCQMADSLFRDHPLVTTVRLTTWPELRRIGDDGPAHVVRLRERPDLIAIPRGTPHPECVRACLAAEWPRVRFLLPTP